MKFDYSRLRRPARLFSGVALLAGIAAPIFSGTTAVSAASSLPAYGTLYVVNQSSDSITVISPSGSTVANIPLPAGSSPTSISVSQDDTTAWVTDSGIGKISEIDLTTNTLANSFPLPSGEKPTSASISGNGYLDVVETGTTNQVVGYSLPDFNLKGTYTPAAGSTDTALAQAQDGSGFSLVEIGTSNNNVQFLDPSSFITASGSAALDTYKNYYISHGPAGYSYFVAEAGSTSGKLVCVFEPGQGCPASLSGGISLPFTPTAIASSPDGNSIVVVGVKGLGGPSPSNQFDYITDVNATLVQTMGTPSGASADSVSFSNDGSKFYVGDSQSNSVSEWSISGSSATLRSTFSGGISDPVGFATSYDVVTTPTFTTTLAAPGDATSFDASATAQPTSPITQYSWDFGDGTNATTSTPTTTHIFKTPGQHQVTLTITDAAGNTSSSVPRYVGFLDPSRHALAYVTNTATNPGTVSVVDTQSNPAAAIGAIALVPDTTFCPPAYGGDCSSPTATGIAASRDFSTVYVAAVEGEGGQGVVDVISTATNEVTAAIAIPATPLQIAVSADDTHLFVLTQGSAGIAAVDLTQNPPSVSMTQLPSGSVPADIAISPDGTHLGVVVDTNNSYPGQSGTGSGSLLDYSISNDAILNPSAPQVTSIATAAPNSLVMSNSSAFVAPSAYDTTSNFYSFSSFDIASGSANYTHPLTAAGDLPDWISLSPDGTTLQMTVNGQSSSYVAVRDAATGKTIQDVGTTGYANLVGIAYTPDGKATFSVDNGNDQVIDVDPYNLISKTSLNNVGPGVTTSIDPFYDVVGQAPAPVVVTTTTTSPTTTQASTTTTLVTTVSQPSSPPTTSVSQPSSTTQSTVIVPSVNTGRPWSSNLWWMLVASIGFVGVIVLRSGSRRRVAGSDESKD
ncbi:MAG: PKD domain-containing protein [Actinomycetota bacterium]|nr:PKD domain-containing protein [Actinomycetota bacterium]